MAQAELFDIDSPCISVCEMDDKGYCKGCLRNRTERQLWHVMNDEQKRQVLRLLFVRRHKQKLALAKLAKQAIFGEEKIAFSQMTFLETEGIEAQKLENSPSIDILPPTTSPNLTAPLPEPLLENKPKVSPHSIQHPKNVIKPLSSNKNLKNSEAIKEENWDFFALLEESLLPNERAN